MIDSFFFYFVVPLVYIGGIFGLVLLIEMLNK